MRRETKGWREAEIENMGGKSGKREKEGRDREEGEGENVY